MVHGICCPRRASARIAFACPAVVEERRLVRDCGSLQLAELFEGIPARVMRLRRQRTIGGADQLGDPDALLPVAGGGLLAVLLLELGDDSAEPRPRHGALAF